MEVTMYFNIKQLKIILNLLVKYNTNKAREVCEQTSTIKAHYRVNTYYEGKRGNSLSKTIFMKLWKPFGNGLLGDL